MTNQTAIQTAKSDIDNLISFTIEELNMSREQALASVLKAVKEDYTRPCANKNAFSQFDSSEAHAIANDKVSVCRQMVKYVEGMVS